MLYQLKGNQKKVNQYIERIKDMRVENKDDEEMMDFLDCLRVRTFEDILNPMNLLKGYEDTPVGFYITYWFNGENDLYLADMKEKSHADSNESWAFTKKRLSHRLELKYGKEWATKCLKYGFGSLAKYGVCDNAHQVIAYYKPFWGELLRNRGRKFVVFMTPVLRANQERVGGWRWHKWGKYIGTQKPQNEYLYDDKHIDLVFTYNIIEVEKLK